MKKLTLSAVLPLLLWTITATASASLITVGSIATNGIAVLGYDPVNPPGNIGVTNTGSSHINVTGDVVTSGTSITGVAGLTYVSGSTITSSTPGLVLANAKTDLTSLITTLSGETYTSLTLNSGVVNTISTSGFYTITTSPTSGGTLGAGTVIDLTGSGQYVFKISGMTFTGVTVNALNTSLTSDDVFWYATTTAANIQSSKIFGDVVEADHANGQLTSFSGAGGGPGTLTGRFLSEAGTTTLSATGGTTLTITDYGLGTPEPSTFGLLAAGVGLLVFQLRRRRA